MKYSMFYASATGNTKQLAEAAEEVFAQETKVEDPADADLVCVGFGQMRGMQEKKSENILKRCITEKYFFSERRDSVTARRISTAS